MPGLEVGEVLIQATYLAEETRIRLTAKGHPERTVDKGISRARGNAEFRTRQLSDELRPRAYAEILTAELALVEGWVVRQVRFFEQA